MSKPKTRKPASFKIEEIEVFAPEAPAAAPSEPSDLPVARVLGLPDLSRGLRWGSLLLGAAGGLVSLIAGLWLYDWTLALLAREDWIGWGAVGLLGVALLALSMIVLREVAGLLRLRRLGLLRK